MYLSILSEQMHLAQVHAVGCCVRAVCVCARACLCLHDRHPRPYSWGPTTTPPTGPRCIDAIGARAPVAVPHPKLWQRAAAAARLERGRPRHLGRGERRLCRVDSGRIVYCTGAHGLLVDHSSTPPNILPSPPRPPSEYVLPAPRSCLPLFLQGAICGYACLATHLSTPWTVTRSNGGVLSR